jgi:hypothetical protein
MKTADEMSSTATVLRKLMLRSKWYRAGRTHKTTVLTSHPRNATVDLNKKRKSRTLKAKKGQNVGKAKTKDLSFV